MTTRSNDYDILTAVAESLDIDITAAMSPDDAKNLLIEVVSMTVGNMNGSHDDAHQATGLINYALGYTERARVGMDR